MKLIKICTAILCTNIIVLLSGCTNNYEKGQTKDIPSTETNNIEYSLSNNEEESTTISKENDKKVVRTEYQKVLKNLLDNGILPDGRKGDGTLGYDITKSKFAIEDVNGDGKEELILFYTSDFMAGMVGYILNYDINTDTLQTELTEFPSMTFYNNGYLKADLSHNQGYAGDFWPYTLYQYDKESNTYKKMSFADAWDKSFKKEGYPEEADSSKSGIVYYIQEEKQTGQANPVDALIYQKWIDSYIGNAKELTNNWMNLTSDNINAIK